VRLTEAGRVFLTEARAVVQRADEAVQTGESRGERAARRNPRRLYAVADGGIALTWTKGAGRGVPQHLLFWAGNRHHALTLSPNEAERVSTSGRRRRTQLTK
jgi:DNA-binding transcriptional LysR family regulator